MKYILAAINALLLAFFFVTLWFIIFAPWSGSILTQIANIQINSDYFVALFIFSILFFIFFTLPLSLFIKKE